MRRRCVVDVRHAVIASQRRLFWRGFGKKLRKKRSMLVVGDQDGHMNLLFLTDLHAHTAWPFSRPLENGRPSRFQDLLNVLTQVEQVLERERITDLVLGGDLTHRRHFINFALYNDLMAAIWRLTVRVKATHILVGNHDYETDTTHSLYAFNFLPHTQVYDQPTQARLSTGEEVIMVPYLHDANRMAYTFEQIPPLPVFGHYAAEGVPLETDYWLDMPLKLGELARFPRVIFGHIHKPSEQLDGRVINVGAPMHFDFGDHGPRYCLLLQGDQATRVPLEAPVFATVKWPRIPRSTVRGYLRILDVPGPKMVEAREAALDAGWMDAVALEGALPPEVREAITGGLVVDQALLAAYVQRRCPDLPAEEQVVLVEEGLGLLKEARG